VCSGAKKNGFASCPFPSVPAEEIEQFVVEQVKKIGKDNSVLARTIAQARRQFQESMAELKEEQQRLQKDLASYNAERASLASQVVPGNGDARAAEQLAEIQERINAIEHRANEVREALLALDRRRIDGQEVAQALFVFDPTWETLTSREKVRIIHLLIERIDFHGATGEMSITFHPSGIKTLTGATNQENHE
jgi:site-specific DNA recombinase